jgi:acyl carrier protein
VKYRGPDYALLISRVKHLVADLFRPDILEPDSLPDDAPLVGGTLDLDSIDLVELAISVEERFGIAVQGERDTRRAFGSISGMARFICSQSPGGRSRGLPAARGVPSAMNAGRFARISYA